MAKARLAEGVVKRTLAQIDAVLAGGGAPAEALWNILGGAVRGPDVPAIDKQGTTAVLRSAAFPLAAAAGRIPGNVNSGFLGPIRTRVAYGHSTHFGEHIKKAAEALGLDVDMR